MRTIEESRNYISRHDGELQANVHALDMYNESNLKKYEMFNKFMKVGNLYTFKYYNVKLPYKLIGNKIPYCDLYPFGILLSIDKKEVKILNLNVIPLKARERLFLLMEKLYHNLININSNNDRVHTWRIIPITEEILKKYIPYDLSIAVNIYKTKYIRKVHGLDWSNLHILMSLSFDKTLFFNRMNRISKRTISRKILLNKRNEKMVKK